MTSIKRNRTFDKRNAIRRDGRSANKKIAIKARRIFISQTYGGGQFNVTRGASYDKFPRNTLQRNNPLRKMEEVA